MNIEVKILKKYISKLNPTMYKRDHTLQPSLVYLIFSYMDRWLNIRKPINVFHHISIL